MVRKHVQISLEPSGLKKIVVNHNFPYQSNIFARARLVLTHYLTEYSPAKTGEYPRIFPNLIFKTVRVAKRFIG